jgi:hypothetical protein
MKRKEKPLTMDEAVKKLAAITDRVMAGFSPEERARRSRKFAKAVRALKKKENAKPLRRPWVHPDRAPTLVRG